MRKKSICKDTGTGTRNNRNDYLVFKRHKCYYPLNHYGIGNTHSDTVGRHHRTRITYLSVTMMSTEQQNT